MGKTQETPRQLLRTLLDAVDGAIYAWRDDKAVESGGFGRAMEQLMTRRTEMFGELPEPKPTKPKLRIYTCWPSVDRGPQSWTQSKRWMVIDVTEGIDKPTVMFKGTRWECYKRELELRGFTQSSAVMDAVDALKTQEGK
jgi:hypothetical protein